MVLATAGLGQEVAQRYHRRCHELRSFLHALSLLETEIRFGRRALPEALAAVARQATPPAAAFLGRLGARLQHPRGPFAEMWQEVLAELPGALAALDREALLELGKALGRAPEEEEVRHLEACQATLAHLLAKAEAEAERKARLWRSAGVISGLAIALLLI